MILLSYMYINIYVYQEYQPSVCLKVPLISEWKLLSMIDISPSNDIWYIFLSLYIVLYYISWWRVFTLSSTISHRYPLETQYVLHFSLEGKGLLIFRPQNCLLTSKCPNCKKDVIFLCFGNFFWKSGLLWQNYGYLPSVREAFKNYLTVFFC